MSDIANKVAITTPKSCFNCQNLKKKDLSVFSYRVRADCEMGVWEGDNFYGEGDYADDTTIRHVCELHQQSKT